MVNKAKVGEAIIHRLCIASKARATSRLVSANGLEGKLDLTEDGSIKMIWISLRNSLTSLQIVSSISNESQSLVTDN